MQRAVNLFHLCVCVCASTQLPIHPHSARAPHTSAINMSASCRDTISRSFTLSSGAPPTMFLSRSLALPCGMPCLSSTSNHGRLLLGIFKCVASRRSKSVGDDNRLSSLSMSCPSDCASSTKGRAKESGMPYWVSTPNQISFGFCASISQAESI